MVKVEIHSFLFICSKISVYQCEKFVLAKFNVGYKLKDFSAMIGGRKINSYVIHVWPDKTVLEMVFVESTLFIWPMYVALRLSEIAEWYLMISKMYPIIHLMLSHYHNTSGQSICSFRIPKTCINHWRPYLFALMASV